MDAGGSCPRSRCASWAVAASTLQVCNGSSGQKWTAGANGNGSEGLLRPVCSAAGPAAGRERPPRVLPWREGGRFTPGPPPQPAHEADVISAWSSALAGDTAAGRPDGGGAIQRARRSIRAPRVRTTAASSPLERVLVSSRVVGLSEGGARWMTVQVDVVPADLEGSRQFLGHVTRPAFPNATVRAGGRCVSGVVPPPVRRCHGRRRSRPRPRCPCRTAGGPRPTCRPRSRRPPRA